jgi:hypothetical protein
MLIAKLPRLAAAGCAAGLYFIIGCRTITAAQFPSASDAGAAVRRGADIQVLDTTRIFANPEEHLTLASAPTEGGFPAATEA